jgi:redox-sensitive bicupin YhaK (pirin superfamily)
MGPAELRGGARPWGAPDHPHRGFETVTYMLDGGVRARGLPRGNRGAIAAGDVQWLTAGKGVVPLLEMPSLEIREKADASQGSRSG